MAEHDEERKGRKGVLVGLLAAIGALVGVLTFWRRRRGQEE
jgi:hypothetical protein